MEGEHGLFILAGVMLVLEAITSVIIPLVIAYVINYLTVRLAQIDGRAVLPPLSPLAAVGLPTVVNPDIDTLAIVTLGIILLTMLNSLGDSMAEIYLARGGRRMGYNVRVALYSHLQKLSLAFHDQRRTGDILTRVTGDVAALEDFIVDSLSDFVGSVLLIVFILVAMLVNAWQVAIVAAVIIPVMAVVSNYYTRRIKAASKRWRSSEGEMTNAAEEMLTSIRVIQVYGLGSYEQELFNDQSKKAMDASLEAANLQAQFSWVVSVLGALSTAAVIWMAVWLIFRAPVLTAGVGLLTAYVKYILDMFKPTKRIISEWNSFGKLSVRVERVGDLLELEPGVKDEIGSVPAPQFKGRLEFRNVSFTYTPVSADHKPTTTSPRGALKNISFTVDPGQIVAVVGHTGAGKSTIVQLIPRLYDPVSGSILIDGHDIRRYTLDSLRAQISMVLQESILFSGSVAENIAYGRPDATGADIIAAAKQANAHEFIEKMPDGYYTMLGERGSNLSGGQRQRISIARGFIRNTSILILDEPTTGLDAESSELVLDALRTLMKGKTTIIISHDLNLIRDVDKIIVIKAGEIEQVGTHEELLAAGGLYADLYHKQSGQPQPALVPVTAGSNGSGSGQVGEKPGVGNWNFDLLRNPAMLDCFPSLDKAFNGTLMKNRFQDALFDSTGHNYQIKDATPGRAIFLPNHQCIVQYNLVIKDETDGKETHTLLNARLFPNSTESEAYYQESLLPLAGQVRGRSDASLFPTPVAVLKDLQAAISVFPVDGSLPTLVRATEKDRMLEVFNETLPEVLAGSFVIDNLRYEMDHYGRYKRCTLRYILEGQQLDSHTAQKRILYGKVDGNGYRGLAIPVLAALQERLRRDERLNDFRIPDTVAYLPDMKLLLLQSPVGETPIKNLIIQRVKGENELDPQKPTLEQAIEASASAAAILHGSQVNLGRRRAITDEIEGLQDELELVNQVLPELGSQMHSWLDDISNISKTSTPLQFCFNQGNFKCTKMVFDNGAYRLVDFDHVCQAEPALDLGQFLAYLRLTIREFENPSQPFSARAEDQLCDLFLNCYLSSSLNLQADEASLRTRISIYENLSLIRLAIHAWQKLKGERLRHAVVLLAERVPKLEQTQISR